MINKFQNKEQICDNKTSQENLTIGGKIFTSRLMLGTGKYKSLKESVESINLSEASIVTVAVRRTEQIRKTGETSLIDILNWKKLWLLPNTAGCETAEEAIRMASLGKEISKTLGQIDNNFVKLEVISDSTYLLPDPIGTLKAAEYLINKNFTVLPYIYPDPVLAKQLEDIGCQAIMPLGSPIGSGQGLKNLYNIKIIIENAQVPIIVDAGAMEIGASAVLLNTAVAKSKSPSLMAESMKLGVISGRKCYLAGPMKKQIQASSSSPDQGRPKLI